MSLVLSVVSKVVISKVIISIAVVSTVYLVKLNL
jgi:hypothetical protein